MGNMELYDKVRAVPKEAQKTIAAGRLKGMTDINPMWRIQKLTETFGPCGIGWKYTIQREWMEHGANNEIAAFMDILLYYKWDGQWSEGIPGTGGSSFVAKERNGLYTSDECYKMALTDAISVAAKAIGMGADVYWEKGRTKYDQSQEDQPAYKTAPYEKEPAPKPKAENSSMYFKCERCGKLLETYQDAEGKTVPIRKHAAGSKEKFGHVYCLHCIHDIQKLDSLEQSLRNGEPA